MKIFLSAVCLLTSIQICAQDVTIFSKTEAPWNIFLMEKARALFDNIGKEVDYRSYTYTEDEIRYDNSTIEEFLTPSSNEFLSSIEHISGLSILHIKPELSIKDIGYNLYNISPDIKVRSISDGVQLEFDISVNGLDINASSVDLNFILPELVSNEKLTVLEVKMLKPQLQFDRSLTMDFKVIVDISKINDEFEISVVEVDTTKLVAQLSESKHLFNIEIEDLYISDVSLDVFGRRVTVDPDKIRNTINQNQELLKNVIVDQMAKLIEKDGVSAIVGSIEKFKIPNRLWFNTTKEDAIIPMNLDVSAVSKINEKIVKVDMNGKFCTAADFDEIGEDCIEDREVVARKVSRSEDDILQAMEMAKNRVNAQNQAVVSVDEDYLTRLLTAIDEEGILEEIKKELDIEIGPQGAMIRFDRTGRQAELYVDVLSRVGKWTGRLISQRTLNFPIKLILDLSVKKIVTDYEDENGVIHDQVELPHLVFKIKDVDISHKLIRYGVPEYGFNSNLGYTVRYGLRGLVVKKIQRELLKYDAETQIFYDEYWNGVELPPIVFPLIKNLELDRLDLESTGKGKLLFLFQEKNYPGSK